MIHHDPVGMPGLVILFLGLVAFAVALMAARVRRTRAGVETVARKRSASWIWIAVQGLGVAIAGFGRIDVTLDAAAPKALAEAAIVALLMVGFVGLFDAASRAMGTNWSLVARTRDDHRLVRSGPFAYVRHPIYVAIFLFMIAMAVAYGHVANLAPAIPVFALGTWMRVRHEERLLRETFDAAYDAYARDVKRFVPGLF